MTTWLPDEVPYNYLNINYSHKTAACFVFDSFSNYIAVFCSGNFNVPVIVDWDKKSLWVFVTHTTLYLHGSNTIPMAGSASVNILRPDHN